MKKSLTMLSVASVIISLSASVFALTPNSTKENISANEVNTNTSNNINVSAPDSLIKTIVADVVDNIKKIKTTQQGQITNKKISELVEQKIIPHADIETTTKMVMGQYWEKATTEQRTTIMQEFKQLLLLTYSGALTKINDQTINYKPLRALPTDTKVVVKSTIIDEGESKSIDYRLHKINNEWKVYDLNILGIGLVASYKPDFNQQLNKNGIDGLIKFLQTKNKKA